MAFVNERIPEEVKNTFTFPVKTYPDGSKPTLSRWTIDRERNAFLVFTHSLGGGYEGTQITRYCVLSWEKHIINLAADPMSPFSTEAGLIMPWRIRELKIPLLLRIRRKAVINLIREAFSVMGNLYDGEEYATVTLDFSLVS